jgi:iron(III) transport system permease protein
LAASLRVRIQREADPWSVSTLLLAALILVPLCTALSGLLRAGPQWTHVAETVLTGYVVNTAILVVAVCALSLLMAIPSAWTVSAFEFPGRRFFEWALVLPLAIPTYVSAIIYFSVPEAAIPLLVQIRFRFGIEAFQIAELILRYSVLAVAMAAVLYPYVFITARMSFSRQRRAVIEAAQTLGSGPSTTFFRVALPLARPAVVAGTSLIVMEVVNDYGAVNFFGVPTLTEGIFRTWFGLGDRASALRLAGLVMVAILAALVLEKLQRGRARYAEHSADSTPLARRRLRPLQATAAILICTLPLLAGFVYPAFRLATWAWPLFGNVVSAEFLQEFGRSLILSLVTALAMSVIALLFAFTLQLHHSRILHGFSRLATLGYATPGAVVAVGVMVVLGAIDNLDFTRAGGGTFFLSGTLYAIGFGYLVRFIAVAFHPVQAGMTRFCGRLDEASRLLGCSSFETLVRINFPLLRGTLLAAAMLVFVDILKELPLTMILRPANFETLATSAFGLAKEGRIHECAVPALIIIAVGAAGLIVLNCFVRPISREFHP